MSKTTNNKKQKTNRYMYTLTTGYDEISEVTSTIGDYIFADNMPAAYSMAFAICADISKQYNRIYTVQSVMPE